MNPECIMIISSVTQLEAATVPESSRGIMEIFGQTLWLLFLIAMPFVVFTLLIHFLERMLQLRLASRFGWRSVLWTGWLGTPIHELSHVIMCVAFRHRVEEVALFEPDLKSGRLGYVKHSWTPGNTFEEIGNFFIGLAPLAGGSIVLAGLLWFFYPESIGNMVETSGIAASGVSASGIEGGNVGSRGSMVSMTFAGVSSLIRDLLSPQNLFSWKFWLFTYLVLCVGGHMAPSRSDYDGASRGVTMVVGSLILLLLAVSLIGVETDLVVRSAMRLLSPIFGLQVIAIVICEFATAVVYLLTAIFPQRYKFT